MSMQAAGTARRKGLGRVIALLIIGAAIAAGLYAIQHRALRPETDDATIDADVVHVASPVGGKIIDIPVAENMQVAKGDLLFQIDPTPYRLTLAQAQAELDLSKATLATQGRYVSTQRSVAVVANDQIGRAKANLQLATDTVQRLTPLAAQGYVPVQQLDQAQTAQRDATTSLAQAQVQQKAAVAAIDTTAGATATVEARRAALAVAQRALDDTTVRATHDGRVVGLTVLTGEVVVPSQSLFTLVNSDEWFADANFREYDLKAIAVGDCATVYSMIDRSRPIRAVVQGIGSGVLDSDKVNVPKSVPYVERELNWVRVAQRFPVRLRLISPPQNLMRLGASAVVEIRHGAACRA
ncbi:MAG TPA: multidrug transporter subunit MdtN [Caulobacteraceae bacterium]|nr:multidrug transporter subunit MdtN [Caulobacteraceae bacterium]